MEVVLQMLVVQEVVHRWKGTGFGRSSDSRSKMYQEKCEDPSCISCSEMGYEQELRSRLSFDLAEL